MSFVSRLVLLLGALVALAVGFALLPPRWADALGLHGCGPSDLRRELVETFQRRSELRSRIDTANRRGAARLRVIEDVIAGRETLFGAAASLRAIGASQPDCPEYPTPFPGSSEGERLCREVIARVANELQIKAPGQVETRGGRLEAELQEHLRAHDGVVVLPGQ